MNRLTRRMMIRLSIIMLLLLVFARMQSTANVRGAIPSGKAISSSSPTFLFHPTIFGSSSPNQQGTPPGVDPALVTRLKGSAQGSPIITHRTSTGVAGFVRVGKGEDLLPNFQGRGPKDKAQSFLVQYGGLFGIYDAKSELVEIASSVDKFGFEDVSYGQVYQGVPVFGAMLHAHLDSSARLSAVNGVFVPGISVNTTPKLSAAEAEQRAIAEVSSHSGGTESEELSYSPSPMEPSSLGTANTKLYVYRDGLIQDLPGPTFLVYQVEVTGPGVREMVFINAHTGKTVNRFSLINDSLFRRLFEQNTSNQVWQEGDLFPGSLNQDQQNIVNYSGNAYYFFSNAFGVDSYDQMGAEMQSVNNDPRISCPNANWNGLTTNYCNGVTGDDVVAHEWGHAYTQYTDNLIYQWQPGALNEAYSDIWGELVDSLNGVGTDSPAPVRSVGVCSSFTTPIPVLTINSPASLAGDYAAAGASFGPALTQTGITGNVVVGDDGTGIATDACEPLVNSNSVRGNIALVDRGSCNFTVKVKNAQNAGAIAAIVANNVVGAPSGMGGADSSITIPSVMVTQNTGNLIKAQPPASVNATLRLTGGSTEDSYRWLMGEDASAFGGAIRDMYNPTCLSDPGKVSDSQYACASSDGGGVHTNSGVINHGFSLLVDGGTYNGYTVTGIGATKAAHIYWRAQSVYQTPTTNFSDHADALQAACTDLIGQSLDALATGPTDPGTSNEIITPADCAQVDEMIQAVELRLDPTAQCNFQPLLAKNPPAFCSNTPADDAPQTVFMESFESGLGSWTLSNQGLFSGWPGLDWTQATSLPGGRSGASAYGADPDAGDCGGGVGDISGAMFMESPAIVIPSAVTAAPHLAFDHYVATEAGYDGGNLKISINGGPYTLVPRSAYIYNPYNTTLETAANGNTDPLAGQPAYSGTDGGQVFGSWGQSQINLGALGVQPGDTIRLRYDLGMDGCAGVDGWYVDDFNLYTCTNTPPMISVAAGGSCSADLVGTMNLNIGDSETPPGNLTLSATSSNTNLVPNSSITFGGSGAARTVTISPTSRQTGSATVTIKVFDGFTSTSIQVQVIVGTNKADVLTGTTGVDMIFGLNDPDTISADAGNDLVCGGNGTDTLNGGPDADSLFGQNGDDTLTGGPGADFFSGGQGSNIATDFNAGEGDTSIGIP